MQRTRIAVAAAGLLWLSHIGVIAVLGTAHAGPVLSDFIQCALGGVLIFVTVEASNRSEGMARSFWRLTALAYMVWFAAQSLSVYNDIEVSAQLGWIINLLFCFWFVPLAMAMFLDPENESGHLDTLVVLDFVQAILVCVAAYLYFFYLPKAESPGELAHAVWTPYFIGYALVAFAFVLRAFVTRSRDAKALFGRMGDRHRAFRLRGCALLLRSRTLSSHRRLVRSAVERDADSPDVAGRDLEAGRVAGSNLRGAGAREAHLHRNLLSAVPVLVLFMSVRIARERLSLAAVVVLLSFLCSSTRQLVTQHRLVLKPKRRCAGKPSAMA